MKFMFVGNRRFVLEEMVAADVDIAAVAIVKGTHLHRDFDAGMLSDAKISQIKLISGKKELLEFIDSVDFDVLVSNGCPYILPISGMKRRIYTNIHPSCLPDLKGVDPVIGAILYNRPSGATCHLMNDAIDAGDIISQVKIPLSSDLDVSLLYQLSFVAEKRVFREALNSGFAAKTMQVSHPDDIYYTRSMKDRCVTFSETNSEIFCKVKAFSNKSQGCFFVFKGQQYRFYEASQLQNPFLLEYSALFSNMQIMFVFEDSVVFRKDGQVIKFSRIAGDLIKFKPKLFFNLSLLSDFLL